MIYNIYTKKENFLEQNKELGAKLPYSDDTSVLAQPLTICSSITLHNRLACQAMEGCDGTFNGSPGKLTIRRYDRFAEGGAGLIWFEATAIMPEARANPRQLYIHKKNLDDFKKEVERIKEIGIRKNGYEPIVIMQATHSGRYSKPEGIPAPLIAYHNPLFEANAPVSDNRIVTDEYLDRVGAALVDGAKLAQKAGFDGVDIKACHRYLNSELLSAYQRPGKYGGSFENRTRLLRESVAGTKEVCGSSFLVSSRLNVYDGFAYPNGFGVKTNGSLDFDPTEPIQLLKQLYKLGMPLINITMGNPYFNPHINRPFADGDYNINEHPLTGVARMLYGTAKLKKAVPQIKIICSALTYLGTAAPHVASEFIKNGGFDVAGFGRTAFAYPDFANDIIKTGEMNKKKICICCSKCTRIMRTKGGTPGCVIRDRKIYGPIFKKQCEENQECY